jgi:hypothetical protein
MDALNKPCWYMADEMKPEPEPHCRFHSIGYCRIDRSRELKEELLGTGGAVEEEANGAVVGGAEDVALPEQRRVPFLERDRPHVDRREARGQAHGRRQNKHRHGSPAREHPHHQPFLSSGGRAANPYFDDETAAIDYWNPLFGGRRISSSHVFGKFFWLSIALF